MGSDEKVSYLEWMHGFSVTTVCFHQPRCNIHAGAKDHGEKDEDDALVSEPEDGKVTADATPVVNWSGG